MHYFYIKFIYELINTKIHILKKMKKIGFVPFKKVGIANWLTYTVLYNDEFLDYMARIHN